MATNVEFDLETLLTEALLGPLSKYFITTQSHKISTESTMKQCPVPWCGKQVKCLWNHVF